VILSIESTWLVATQVPILAAQVFIDIEPAILEKIETRREFVKMNSRCSTRIVKRIVKMSAMDEIDEPVHLSPYSLEWPVLFAAEARRITSALPVQIAIEHIGSTSVVGLLAKPIVDIMTGIQPHDAEDVRRGLRSLGYDDLGEAGVPGRLYFRRRVPHPFNVHVVQHDGPIWSNNIALREYLRRDNEAARTYAEVKRSAVESGATMLLSYSEYKRKILSDLIARALARGGK
jgi:GrpB-like predicted nucleotidyltransferase (UPF0157 family)